MEIDYSSPEQVLQSYINCCRCGDAAGLEQLFHPQAAMYGYLNGELMAPTPQPFFEAVANAPCPESSGEPYQAEITVVETTGATATLVLKESNYLGMRFTNSFQLLKTDGRWWIVSKLFQSS